MLTTATVWVAGWLGDAQDAHLRTVFGALVGLWDLCWPVLADHKTVAGGWDAHTDRLGHWSTSAGGALALAHLGYSADPSNVVLLDPLDLASELAASLPVHYQVRGCTRSVSEQAARSRRAGTGDRSWLQAMAAHELTARIQRAVPASVRDGEADWARLFAAAWRGSAGRGRRALARASTIVAGQRRDGGLVDLDSDLARPHGHRSTFGGMAKLRWTRKRGRARLTRTSW